MNFTLLKKCERLTHTESVENIGKIECEFQHPKGVIQAAFLLAKSHVLGKNFSLYWWLFRESTETNCVRFTPNKCTVSESYDSCTLK